MLGSSGCWADVQAFRSLLEARIKMYKFEHEKTISTKATAQLVSNMLYGKRFFPYYVSNILVLLFIYYRY